MLFIWDSPAGQASFIASKVFSISSAKKFSLSGDDLSRAFRRGEGLAVFPAQALDLEVCHDFDGNLRTVRRASAAVFIRRILKTNDAATVGQSTGGNKK